MNKIAVNYVQDHVESYDYVCNSVEGEIDHIYPIEYIFKAHLKYKTWHLPTETLNCYLLERYIQKETFPRFWPDMA